MSIAVKANLNARQLGLQIIVIKPLVSYHYFVPGPQLLCQLQSATPNGSVTS